MRHTATIESDPCCRADRYAHDPSAQQRFGQLLQMIPADVQLVLDVGCGDGLFLRLLEESAFHGYPAGLEQSKAAIEKAVCSAEIYHGSIEDIPFEDNTFHLVTAQQVLEHLPCGIYENSLRELERVARDYILISVPFREKRIWITCEYCGCRLNPWGHLRTFELETMQRLFKRFELIETSYVYIDQVIGKDLIWGIYSLLTGRRRPFKAYICPQCGFCPTKEAGDTELARHARQKALIARILPTRRVVNNIICLYKRL